MKNTIFKEEINHYPKDETIRSMELFFGIFSHEINTQLAGIRQCYACIQEGKTDSKINTDFYLQALNAISNNTIHVFNSLLTTVKFHAGKLEIEVEKETFRLSSWLETIIQSFEASTIGNDKSISVTVQDMEIATDKIKLAQILHNLLVNARKFRYPDTRISVKCHTEGTKLVLQVINIGNGIPANKIADLFKPYHQFENSYGGTGLGLYICQLYAKALGGNITVHSEAKNVTIFTVLIPDCIPRKSNARQRVND